MRSATDVVVAYRAEDARLLTRLAVSMEGDLMCRVTAPLGAMFSREAASCPSLSPALTTPLRSILGRRLRIARHRLLRWFDEPIAIIERKRRGQDVTVWRYDFRPRGIRRFAQPERATKSVA